MNEYEFNNGVSELIQFRIFDLLTELVGRVTFVQIGANDGKSNDAIFPYVEHKRWKGAVVEPVPYLFERLKVNYNSFPEIQCFQLACSRREGELTFYMVDERAESDSLLAPFLSSFDKATILRHKQIVPNLEKNIRELKIQTVRVDRIMEHANYDNIDLLMVDTEGTDDDVVLSLDYSRYRPEVVIVEHKHIAFDGVRSMDMAMERGAYNKMRLFQDTIYFGPRMWENPEVRRWARGANILFDT